MNPYVTALKHMMKLICSTRDVCGLWYQHQTVVTKHYLTEIQILMMQYIDPPSWCDGVCDRPPNRLVWQLIQFVRCAQCGIQCMALLPNVLLGCHHTERSKLFSGVFKDFKYSTFH